jgi:hypothetical protein
MTPEEEKAKMKGFDEGYKFCSKSLLPIIAERDAEIERLKAENVKIQSTLIRIQEKMDKTLAMLKELNNL